MFYFFCCAVVPANLTAQFQVAVGIFEEIWQLFGRKEIDSESS